MTLVAVTGAAGFIGRATCRALVDSAIDVRAFLRRRPAEGVLPSAATVVVREDLARGDALEPVLSGVDAVIHLAARVPERRVSSDPADAAVFHTNVVVAERVLRAAARAGVKRFVYVSSVKAVGEQTVGAPWNEESAPRPTEPYGRSKLLGEATVRRLSAELGIEAVVLRPPLVYGPEGGGHFPRLISLAKLSQWVPLPLGGIPNRRSVLFVQNLANALVLLSYHRAAAGETFFIADGPPRSTAELIRALGAAIGVRPRLIAVSPSVLIRLGGLAGVSAEINKLCASLEVDDTRLRRLTGWVPPYSFEEAIARTVERPIPLVSQDTHG